MSGQVHGPAVLYRSQHPCERRLCGPRIGLEVAVGKNKKARHVNAILIVAFTGL
jgi:hypothetical protein